MCIQIQRALLLLLPPATKLRQGNVFTPDCDSVYGGGSLSWGVFVQWGLCLGGGGICPGGSLFGGVSVQGGSYLGVSVMETHPTIRLHAGSTHPTRMHSC